MAYAVGHPPARLAAAEARYLRDLRIRLACYDRPMPRMRDAGTIEIGGERVKRRLLTTTAILSLLLCVAAAALWVRSYWRPEHLVWRNVKTQQMASPPGWVWTWQSAELLWTHGGLMLHWQRGQKSSGLMPAGDGFRFSVSNWPVYPRLPGPPGGPSSHFDIAGFEWRHTRHVRSNGTADFSISTGAVVPMWAIVLLSGTTCGLSTWRRMRDRLPNTSSRCTTCGYCLTGNTSGVCPECGMPVAERVKA